MIDIQVGDISCLDVDVIVNAANESLLGGGGVDGAIHRAAGTELLGYTRNLGGCPAGEARLTPGFNLKAKHVIHTVGPMWSGGGHGEAGLLRSCYESVFQIAGQLQIHSSIAFPAISTGVYRYPKEEAAGIALSVMREFEERYNIIICCFSGTDAAIYRRVDEDQSGFSICPG